MKAHDDPMPIPLPFQLSRMVTSYWVPQSIHAAAVLGIADVLAAGPMPSRDVARAVDADPAALHRLLRALVTLELCTVADDGRFALTPLGACLRRDSKDSVRAWALLLGSDEHQRAWGRLAECIRTGRSVPALDGRETWVDRMDDPAASADFDQSMVQLTRHIAGAIAVSYDFSTFRTIVDVGGGWGALLPPILKANTALRGIVYDLPRCRDGARALAEKTHLADRLTFTDGDFFTDRLPAADAYLVKSVIHDWDDERSTALLRNVRAAMTPEARLLVVEPIMPERPGTSGFDAMLAHTDLNMLVVTGGRERTEADFRRLLEGAGFTVTSIVATPATMSIIEGRRC
jgi:hypothetical protein